MYFLLVACILLYGLHFYTSVSLWNIFSHYHRWTLGTFRLCRGGLYLPVFFFFLLLIFFTSSKLFSYDYETFLIFSYFFGCFLDNKKEKSKKKHNYKNPNTFCPVKDFLINYVSILQFLSVSVRGADAFTRYYVYFLLMLL